MSKNNLVVKVSKRTTQGVESWEGTVSLQGVAPTKLVKAKTNDSKFSSRSALNSAAQRLADRYGFEEVQFEGGEQKAQKVKTKRKETVSVETVSAQ